MRRGLRVSTPPAVQAQPPPAVPATSPSKHEKRPLAAGALFLSVRRAALFARGGRRLAPGACAFGESAVSPAAPVWLPSKSWGYLVTAASGGGHRVGSWRSLRSNLRARS